MNIFAPFSTYESPSRRAVVRMPFTSEPASGSVTAMAQITLPATISGIQRSRCAWLPALKTCTEAMSVWTSAVMAKPEKVERPSSSASTTVASVSSSEPPYSAG